MVGTMLNKTTLPLIDGHQRKVDYLRLSVTDRCDLRCTYCMAEKMKFLPKSNLLDFEQMHRLCSILIERGIRTIRLSGGEPLVRKGILDFIRSLSPFLASGALHELTLTTNATTLATHASALYAAGVRRVNVSLDSLDPEIFKQITRRDQLASVLHGIEVAQAAGLTIKLNTVALRQLNFDALPAMVRWAHQRGIDITLIEIMPMGDVEQDRFDQYVPLAEVKTLLSKSMTLIPSDFKTSGPSRYMQTQETGGRIGFITPLSNNFCANCNRIRITCTGQLYTCLGSNGMVDLRDALQMTAPHRHISKIVDEALRVKPAAHNFDISEPGQIASVARHMSVTGG